MSIKHPIVTDEHLKRVIDDFVKELSREYKRVLVITPDSTRTCPLERIIPLLQKYLRSYGLFSDYLIALGTHRYMEQQEIHTMYGINEGNLEDFKDCSIENHEWMDPATFASFGKVELVEGQAETSVEIQLNRKILDYDVIIPISPVFPHEIVGFSGGPKYFFPGISGGDFLQKMHWHAVCIGRHNLMGKKNTPTRNLIDRAAQSIPKPVCYMTMAVDGQRQIRQISCGKYHDSWDKTVEVSTDIHIVRTGRTYKKVVAIAPEMYDELWTAGKAMYKLDQIIEPGGELILYGPHISEFSHMWNKYVYKMGFHTLDYLQKHKDSFSDIPEGVLSFSTNVRGVREEGSTDIDKPKIELIMATGISEADCSKVNLQYRDYRSLDWDAIHKDPDILVVKHAGEILHLV
jgi:nickel-dependent lactate racemase